MSSIVLVYFHALLTLETEVELAWMVYSRLLLACLRKI